MAVLSFMARFVSVPHLTIARQGMIFILLASCVFLKLTVLAEELPSTAVLKIGNNSYYVDVANTEEKSFRGLMYRTEVPAGTGMAFPFSPQKIALFWMKNTLIPLDMVFVQDGKIVRLLESVPPCPKEKGDRCPLYSSVVPVDWVYELPASTIRSDHIRLRQQAKLKFPETSH